MPLLLRWSRRGVGGNVQHVFRGKLCHDGLHQIGPGPFAHAGLHIVKLTYDITWRTTREPGNRTESFKARAVTNSTLCGLATPVSSQRLTFLDAARWNVGHKAR